MKKITALLALLATLMLPMLSSAANWEFWRTGSSTSDGKCGDKINRGMACFWTFDSAGSAPKLRADGCVLTIYTSTASANEVALYKDSAATQPIRYPDESGSYGDTVLTDADYYVRGVREQTVYAVVNSGTGTLEANCQ